MGNKVQSKNIGGYLKVSGNYYPVFCGKSLSYRRTQDLIETTNVTSGSDRDYEAGMTTGSFDITGVTILDNSESRIAQNYIEQTVVRKTKQDWKITETDDDGNIHVRTFQGLVKETGFDKSIPGYSQSTVSVQICGPVTMDTVEPPASGAEVIYSDWWTFPAGATSISGTSDVHSYTLEGVTVLEVNREGLNYDIITIGSPSNRQCKHNNTTGTISFDTTIPSNGETVFVLFKVIL